MKLKAKLLLIVSLVFCLFVSGGVTVLHMVMYPRFMDLEQEEARRDMERGRRALKNEIDHLQSFAADWAHWDDSYRFVLDHNQSFIKSNLSPQTFADAKLNLIYFLDRRGNVVWGKIYDHDFTTIIESPVLIRECLPKRHLQKKNMDPLRPVHGLQRTSAGPMLISLSPITAGNGTGSPMGTLVMGRFFNKSVLTHIAEQVDLELTIVPLTSADIPSGITKGIQKGSDPDDILFDVSSSADAIYSYMLLRDVVEKPLLLLRGKIPMNISNAGIQSFHFALSIILVIGFMMLLTLIYGLQRIIVRPLQELSRHTLRIGKERNLAGKVPLDSRSDELGILAKEINKMLRRIHELYATQEDRVANRTEELSRANSLLKQEIRKHRLTDKQRQRALDELEIIFQNTQAGIIVLKGDRTVSRVNQRFCEIMGYKNPEDVIGRSVRDFHASELRFLDFGEKYYSKLIKGISTPIEYPLQRKDGTEIWCLLTGKVLDSSKTPDAEKRTIWIVDDISKQIESEARLKDLAYLQGTMSTVGAVCHEIAQPIQVIDNQLHMLQNKPVSAAQMREGLEVIRQENERLTTTTRKLRKISKYETMDYVSGVKILDIEKSSSGQ